MEIQEINAKLTSPQEEERLSALTNYIKEHPKRIENGYINLHIHTNESFSVFRSPTEAVWHGFKENIEYLGINDHYSIDGHLEFSKACKIAGIKAAFSIEAIAMDESSHREGRRFNDPNNPGRTYLVGKGVTRDLSPKSREFNIFSTMKRAIQERNRKMASKIESYLTSSGYDIPFSYDNVVSLTPRGNATERHVVQALCEKIDAEFADIGHRRKVYEELLQYPISEKQLQDVAELHRIVRAQLVKSGRPCYVEENADAFTSIENLVQIYRAYGAVPTYPFLGNPVSEWESDLQLLVKKVKKYGLYAFDLFDFRTPIKRAREIVTVAKEIGFPVFIGTEHNTKKMIPLAGELGKSPEFYDYFRKSADFVLGHQRLTHWCNLGYIRKDGKPRCENLHEGFERYAHVGSMKIAEDELNELLKKPVDERRKYLGVLDLR